MIYTSAISRGSILKSWLQYSLLAGLLVPFSLPAQTGSSGPKSPDIVSTEQFSGEVTEFLGKELSSHLADVRTPGVAQERVVGAQTLGEFSWGTFARSLASYSVLTNNRALAGRDLPQAIGKIGLIEARGGGKAFAQLYVASVLGSYGPDLGTHPRWRHLPPL